MAGFGIARSRHMCNASTLAVLVRCWLVETVNLNAYTGAVLRARRPRLRQRLAIISNISAALSRCKPEVNTIRSSFPPSHYAVGG